MVDAYASDSRTGLRNWLGLAGSVDYGGGASGLFAIALGLVAQARGDSNGVSVSASLAQYAQFIQSDRIVTGANLPQIPEAPMPLGQVKNGAWQYTQPVPRGATTDGSNSIPVVTLESLRSRAATVTDAQIGGPCPSGLSAASVIRQEQQDGSTDRHPAPTHVRFEKADDPIIVSAAVLDNRESGS